MGSDLTKVYNFYLFFNGGYWAALGPINYIRPGPVTARPALLAGDMNL